jgi:hypothetical protein
LYFFLKDRTNNNNNNNNANISGDELDEELGDFQLPLTPRASSSLSHNIVQTNVISQQRSSSTSATIPFSLQHDVVLHSNIDEPLLPATDRFDLNLSLDRDLRNQLNRKANSLMTVYEQTSANETTRGESSSSKSETWRAGSPSSICDLTYQRITNVPISEKNTDQQETVKRYLLNHIFDSFLLGMTVNVILPIALCSFYFCSSSLNTYRAQSKNIFYAL